LGAELFHVDGGTDGRTNMTNLIVALRKFGKKPKTLIQNQIYLHNPIIPFPIHLLFEILDTLSVFDITQFYYRTGEIIRTLFKQF